MSTMKTKPLLADADLTTPMHDSIQSWAHGKIPKWIDEYNWDNFQHPRAIICNTKDRTMGKPEEYEIIWEKPLCTKSGFFAGYLDLLVKLKWPSLGTSFIDLGWVYEIKSKIPSFGELLRQLQTYKELCDKVLFREPIEQQQIHKSCFVTKIIVICPNDNVKPILESQGFEFIKYTGDESTD